MRTVYFFTSPMCGVCEEWKPVIDAFIAKRGSECFTLRCNPNLRPYAFGDWKVKYTPSAMVQELGQMLRHVEGKLLSLEELEEFVFGDAPDEEQDQDDEDDDEEEQDEEDE